MTEQNIEINDNILSSTSREDLLKTMAKIANPKCNTCYGRGHVGFKEDKNGSRTYIPCGKCIDKHEKIPQGFTFVKKNKKRN